MNIQAREGIEPISDFRKDSASVLKRLKNNREPILLTQRGRSVAVLLDIETFEKMEYAAHLRASYQRGIANLKNGDDRPHSDVANEFK
ncbi:MAG: type II toxin-antitoxin system Phd/YefM family antitoxin [Elusimicrobiota bacterium]